MGQDYSFCDDGDSKELPSPKIFDAFWDSIVDPRALIVLLWALGCLFGLSLASMPSSAHAATEVKDVPLCEHDVAPVDVGLHARNVAASKVVKTWMQPKGDEITMKAKAGKKLVDVICRTAKEREYALDTNGRVYDTACGNQIVKGYTIPTDVKPVVPAPAAKPAIPAPAASAPASTPCSNCVTSVPKCWTDIDVKAKVCVGSPPDGCGCFIAAKAGTTFRGAYFPDILKSAPCLTAKVALAKKHGWVLTDHQ